MDNIPATKADIVEIKNMLKDKSWWEKWGSTVVVAVIAGIFSIYTTCMQNRNATQLNNTQTTLTRFIEDEKNTGMLIAQERVSFYKEMKILLEEIDSSYQQVCYFASVKKGDQLASALEKYRKQLELSPEGLDVGIKNKLREYSESVARGWLELDSTKVSEAQRKDYYKNSQKVLGEAQTAVKEIMQHRTVPKSTS